MAQDVDAILEALSGGFDPQQAKLRLLQQQLEQANALSGSQPQQAHSVVGRVLNSGLSGIDRISGALQARQARQEMGGIVDQQARQQGSFRQLMLQRAQQKMEQEQAERQRLEQERQMQGDPNSAYSQLRVQLAQKRGYDVQPGITSGRDLEPVLKLGQDDYKIQTESGDKDADRKSQFKLLKMKLDYDTAKDATAKEQKKGELTTELRKEYNGRQQTKDIQKIRSTYAAIPGTPGDGAGDISLLYNYLHVVEPTSQVKEGEFATVGKAGGLPNQVQGYFQTLQDNKGVLPPAVRKSIKDEAARIVAAKEAEFAANTVAEFEALSSQMGLDVGQVLGSAKAGKQGGASASVPGLSPAESEKFKALDAKYGQKAGP